MVTDGTMTGRSRVPAWQTKTCDRTCENCGGDFKVPYPSDRRRFCSLRCGTQHAARRRQSAGNANPNWRGGKTTHPLYDLYNEMLARCHRPTHKRYADYGGRGITVCQRWRIDFWAFVADMGERPAGVLDDGRAAWSLDRVDNDRGYSPDNCRWADLSTQMKNRRPSAYAGSVRDEATGRFLPTQAIA